MATTNNTTPAETQETVLLDVQDVAFSFRTYAGEVQAVRGVSFTLARGKCLGIVGESGCGKSVMAKSIIRLNPSSPKGIYKRGQILFEGRDLLSLSKRAMESVRASEIRMIFQDPSTSLNPRQRISQILDFPLRLNTDLDAEARQKQIIDTLRMVGLLPDHVSYYPHMLAPGQKQRLGLARALILRPKVIICDEALASLDMSMRSQLINLMLELQEKQGISYIYVTQHLGMMKHISDQVLVMHQGEVVERGSTADVLASPLHDLTKRLIAGHFGEALTADAWRKDR